MYNYKILIIGNGFDLEHGFKTGYIDFLEATKEFLAYKRELEPFSVPVLAEMLKISGMEDEFLLLTEGNAWLAYFFDCLENGMLSGEKWIDCEREIGNIINVFEKHYIDSEGSYIFIGKVARLDGKWDATPLVKSYHFHCGGTDENYWQICNEYRIRPKNIEFVEYLFQQLREFTRLFEIYCLLINKLAEEFAETHDLRKTADRINALRVQCKNQTTAPVVEEMSELNMLVAKHEELLPLKAFDVDRVLSFNYTNTCEILYGNSETRLNCYFIHGKAQNDFKQMKLVLGIDDPLVGEEASSELSFAKFKKYYQRIIYETDSDYKDLIADMELSSEGASHEIYLVGHSLGATDHDILHKFFNMYDSNYSNKKATVKITAYYHDEAIKNDIIQRVIKIVGKEKFIERVNGTNGTIRFVNQYDEEQGIFSYKETEFKKMIKSKLDG